MRVFQNTNAAYLNIAGSNDGTVDRFIPSPLNIGIENSRRFRALPVYASFAAYGRQGFQAMLERQIQLARAIARLIVDSPKFELLPVGNTEQTIYVIVLFRAKNVDLNKDLVKRINATRKIYISGTQWNGEPAARFAVATWRVHVERDLATIKEVLEGVAE